MSQRVNISLGQDMHKKAKVIAILKDLTLNEYLESAIKDAVRKDNDMIKEIK